jgi:RimJ/RimL family protein N-acetyltransferase
MKDIEKLKETEIETKHLILRPLKKGDEFALVKYLKDKEIYTNTAVIPYPYTLEDGKSYIKKSKNFKKDDLFTLDFALYHKDLKEVIGIVALIKVDLDNKNAESGSWIGKQFWGSGLIHEAKIEMYKFAFEKLKLVKIYSKVFDYNPRSFKHLEKLGFTRQGIFRKHFMKDKKLVDNYYYEMLKEEFNYKLLKEEINKKYFSKE